MPIRQRDADQNIQTIKTLNDITAQTPLHVSIPGTLTSTDTVVQNRLGGTNSTPAASPTTDTGLSGVIRGLWKDLADRFLSLVGTAAEAPSATGSLMARLGAIASATPSSGGSGGTTNVAGVEARLGATDETPSPSDTASSGLNGILKRYLARFTTFLTVLGTTTDTASATGSLMARLGQIATNGTGGGSGTSAVYSSAVNIASVTVTTTVATIAEIVTADYDYLSLWIQNTGAVALNELKTEAGFSASLAFKYAFLAGAASSGSYSTGTGKQSGNSLIPIIFANNLPALAGGGDGFVEIDVRRYQRIRLQASVASGTTTVVINGMLMR